MIDARTKPRVKGNRLAAVWYNAEDTSDPNERVATYGYDGLFRRIAKVVTNQGSGLIHGSDPNGVTGLPAGDRSEQYYYSGWRLIETRNGSDQTLGQFVYGTQYIDEPLRYDRNTDFGSDNDCLDAGSAAYFYHQDANYRVVLLTDESGAVAERYDYTAYGEPTVFGGEDENGEELANAYPVSRVGNPLMHQGLFRDPETRTYQNRFRQYDSELGRFMQWDPLGYANQANSLEYLASSPVGLRDPRGLAIILDMGEEMRRFFLRLLHDMCPDLNLKVPRDNAHVGLVTEFDPGDLTELRDECRGQPDGPNGGDRRLRPWYIRQPATPTGPKGPAFPEMCRRLKELIDSPLAFVIRLGSDRSMQDAQSPGAFVLRDERGRPLRSPQIWLDLKLLKRPIYYRGQDGTVYRVTGRPEIVLIDELTHAHRYMQWRYISDNPEEEEREQIAETNTYLRELGLPPRAGHQTPSEEEQKAAVEWGLLP